jgi:hypothetical protein
MNKKRSASFIIILGLALLLLYSCNEPTSVENKAIGSKSLLKETKKEVKIIGYKTIIENGKEKKSYL